MCFNILAVNCIQQLYTVLDKRGRYFIFTNLNTELTLTEHSLSAVPHGHLTASFKNN